jgi:hypothetical protein
MPRRSRPRYKQDNRQRNAGKSIGAAIGVRGCSKKAQNENAKAVTLPGRILRVIMSSLGHSTKFALRTSPLCTERLRCRLQETNLRLETAKGRHKVLDLANRRGFAGFEVALNA